MFEPCSLLLHKGIQGLGKREIGNLERGTRKGEERTREGGKEGWMDGGGDDDAPDTNDLMNIEHRTFNAVLCSIFHLPHATTPSSVSSSRKFRFPSFAWTLDVYPWTVPCSPLDPRTRYSILGRIEQGVAVHFSFPISHSSLFPLFASQPRTRTRTRTPSIPRIRP